MRGQRKFTGAGVLGIALLLFACQVETSFTENDTAADAAEDTLSVALDAGGVDVVEPDAGTGCIKGCGAFEECVDDTCVPTYCPPQGPFGVMAGDTLLDAVVKDCDGNDVHIHEMCGKNAGFFNLLAGW